MSLPPSTFRLVPWRKKESSLEADDDDDDGNESKKSGKKSGACRRPILRDNVVPVLETGVLVARERTRLRDGNKILGRGPLVYHAPPRQSFLEN